MSAVPKKPGRRGWKYLVFWNPEKRGQPGEISVESSSTIPARARKEGALIKLPWIDNGVTRYYDVNVLKKGDDEEQLLALDVNAFTGEILKPEDRAFTSTVYAMKRNRAVVSRGHTKAISNANQDVRFEALTSGRICDIADEPPAMRDCTEKIKSSLTSLTKNSHTDIPVQSVPASKALAPLSPPKRVIFSAEEMVMRCDSELTSFCSWDSLKLIESVCLQLKPHSHENLETRAVTLFMEALKDRLQLHADNKVKLKNQKPRSISLPEHFFIKTPEKVELFPGEQFYIHQSLFALIQARCQTSGSWKRYADIVLSEIYGENLKWLSCEGLRNTQGIHKCLRSGLFAYAVGQDPTVTPHDFTWHVNNLISNRKNCWRRKNKTSLIKSSTKNKTVAEKLDQAPGYCGKDSLADFAQGSTHETFFLDMDVSELDVANMPVITDQMSAEISMAMEPAHSSGDVCFKGESIPSFETNTIVIPENQADKLEAEVDTTPSCSSGPSKAHLSPKSAQSFHVSPPSQNFPQLDPNNPYHKAIAEILFKMTPQSINI